MWFARPQHSATGALKSETLGIGRISGSRGRLVAWANRSSRHSIRHRSGTRSGEAFRQHGGESDSRSPLALIHSRDDGAADYMIVFLHRMRRRAGT